jgi:thiamine transport system ATP-binding protein
MRLELESVSVDLEGQRIVHDVDLAVESGERIALLGPSGSGKSTLLRTIAGLRAPSAGRVLADGNDLASVPTHLRGIGLVFQDGALFPHRDVAGNVGYGLEIGGVPRAERAGRVAEALELVGLAGIGERRVETLSGGEAQRVALARALAPRPRALLLDEPLGALDGPLRARLQDDLRALFARLALTVVHVTHDVEEAFALGDRVAVLREGRLAQVASPTGLWRAPADDWVARFLGMRNVEPAGAMARVTRPEAVRLTAGGGARVVEVEPRGSTARVVVTLENGRTLEAITTELNAPNAGSEIGVTVDPAGVVDVPVWSDPKDREG